MTCGSSHSPGVAGLLTHHGRAFVRNVYKAIPGFIVKKAEILICDAPAPD